MQEKFPHLSSYMNYARTIEGTNLNKRTISSNFNSLVDKEDYSKSDKLDLINNLVILSQKGLRTTKN